MKEYLQECKIIDLSNENLQKKAKELAFNCKDDEEIVKKCFLFVRDEIKHLGDNPSNTKVYVASDVLEKKTGWCYAKSHLLAALLRINKIPTALSYQRLSCGEYKNDIYCFHGLNAVYLKKYGWYRIDARGNKKGVDAQFTPPVEKLAFNLEEGEIDIDGLYTSPLPQIVDFLEKYEEFEEMCANFPN